MLRRIMRLGLSLLGIVTIALVSLAAYTQTRWDRTFDAPYPDVRATDDPAIIEQGRYLVYGPAHCAACHTPPESHEALRQGEIVPLVGGFEWKLPLGTVRSANLTPDRETGIGRFSDAEVARVLRYGVKPDGRAAMPFMEFQHLSDADLQAILSYLRSTAPVRNEVRTSEPNFVGRAMLATLIRPAGPERTPPSNSPEPAATVERGAYLVNDVAGCAGCHSARDMMDGSYIGPRLAGGTPMPLDDDPTVALVPPNLTPDPATGHISAWSVDQFVSRFRAGELQPGTHMPWTMYSTMSDDDLHAIYRYLRSIEPVTNETGPLRQPVR